MSGVRTTLTLCAGLSPRSNSCRTTQLTDVAASSALPSAALPKVKQALPTNHHLSKLATNRNLHPPFHKFMKGKVAGKDAGELCDEPPKYDELYFPRAAGPETTVLHSRAQRYPKAEFPS